MKTNDKALYAMAAYEELSVDLTFVAKYIDKELKGDQDLLNILSLIEENLEDLKYTIGKKFLNQKEIDSMGGDEILEEIKALLG